MKKGYLFDKHFSENTKKEWWVVEGTFPDGSKNWAVMFFTGKEMGKLKRLCGPFESEKQAQEWLTGYLKPLPGEFGYIPATNGFIYMKKSDFPEITFISPNNS